MKYLKDWKVHALCFVMVIVSELIGKHSFSFGPVGFTLFPMLYALIIGIILAQFKLIDREMMATASPYITISVMYLTAKMASSIGPNLEAVLNAGPALILQEFGNLGTIFLSLSASSKWGVLLLVLPSPPPVRAPSPSSATCMVWTPPRARALWALTSPVPCWAPSSTV